MQSRIYKFPFGGYTAQKRLEPKLFGYWTPLIGAVYQKGLKITGISGIMTVTKFDSITVYRSCV